MRLSLQIDCELAMQDFASEPLHTFWQAIPPSGNVRHSRYVQT